MKDRLIVSMFLPYARCGSHCYHVRCRAYT